MSGRKRGAAEAAAGAPSSSRQRKSAGQPARASPRVAGLPAANYNEDGVGAQGPVLADELERAFWEQWDTPLLWAWIDDYKRKDIEMTAALKADREALIRILVLNAKDWVQRPAEGVELETLQGVWTRRAKPHRLDPIPARAGQPVAAPQRAAEVPASMEPQAPTPARKGKKSAAKPAATASDSDGDREADDDEGMWDATPGAEPVARAIAFPAIRAQGPEPAQASLFAVCSHCSCRNQGQAGPAFPCSVCGLISGMPEEHRLNQLRLANMSGPRAPAAAAAASSSSAAASGQFLTDMFEGSSATQRREKEIKEFLKLASNPAFDEPAPGAQFPHTAALEVGRQAYNAPAYEMPSPALLQAIRKGVLYKIGFAKPRLLSESAAARHGITLEGGTLTAAIGSTPKLESLEDFCFSMFSTILPALVDRPKALAEWLALGRTALEIHTSHKKGWAAVSNYLDQFLAERTFARKPYADVSIQILSSTVILAPASSSAFGARGPQPAAAAGVKFCSSYNFRAEGCTRDGCAYKHECQYASQGCKDTRGHRAIDCPHKPPHLALKSTSGSRGRGAGKDRGNDAASVRSAPGSGAKPKE